MNIIFSEFKRIFSMSMYKNKRIPMGEMTFTKDFVTDTRGDLYPVQEISDGCLEKVSLNRYTVENGSVKRIFCRFFPYASYEVTGSGTGAFGFVFRLPDAEASISVCDRKLLYRCNDAMMEQKLPEDLPEQITLIVTCRPGAFDTYFCRNGKSEFFCTIEEDAFSESNQDTVFYNSYVLLSVSGDVTVESVYAYLDNHIAIADIKAVTYENGDVMMEQGKVFLTASVRMERRGFQGIYSWVPGTEDIQLTGALFFDCGDGKWRDYLASSLVYHREKKEWLIWVSSFEHIHILAHARFQGEPRYGVNVVDVTFMPKADETSDFTDFVGFRGDEDPDFYYDAEKQKWIMAICRVDPETKKYAYLFYASEDPFTGYTYIGRGVPGSETGGSFVKICGERFFTCGNSFHAKSEYRIYGKDGMELAKFNHPDGGFRGWGTVLPVNMGSRIRYFWLTFDRHNSSEYNWSYGNLYIFELGIDTKEEQER